jgi:sedoheptulose-bisphosphatase
MTAFVPASAVSMRSVPSATRATSLRSSSSVFATASPALRRCATVSSAAPASRRSAATTKMIATGQALEDWLDVVADKDLVKCTRGMFSACKEIAYKIRTASCDKISCFNDFGDEQLAIDVLADKCIFDNLEASGVVATASSEEVPVEKPITEGGKFSVAYVPCLYVRPIYCANNCQNIHN